LPSYLKEDSLTIYYKTEHYLGGVLIKEMPILDHFYSEEEAQQRANYIKKELLKYFTIC